MGKEEFKTFVKKNPHLANYVIDKKMTWQQFYELFDLYGEDNSIWKNFHDLKIDNNINNSNFNNTSNLSSSFINTSTNFINNFRDFMGLFKGIDLNNVQKTLTSLDKAIDAFKGISSERNENDNNISNYEERPKYKYFED